MLLINVFSTLYKFLRSQSHDMIIRKDTKTRKRNITSRITTQLNPILSLAVPHCLLTQPN